MKLELMVDDEYFSGLMNNLLMTPHEVEEAAHTILSWCVNEALNKRIIISCDNSGQNAARLALPYLDKLSGYVDSVDASNGSKAILNVE